MGEESQELRWYDVEYTVRGAWTCVSVGATSPEEALKRAAQQRHWGRNFRLRGHAAPAQTKSNDPGDRTMTTTTSEIRSLPIDKLRLSATPAQIERRRRLDKAKIVELAETIKVHGLVHPILVRPLKAVHTPGLNGYTVGGKTIFSPEEAEEVARNTFEIVAGERRYLAVKHAKLAEIDCTVRELTDEQTMELQLIENLGREDIHPLAEAEGYEALQKRGQSVEDIAAKVGHSKATVYARMKLLALGKECRKAFYDGMISASVALLLARIPVEDLQQEALAQVLEGEYGGEPMSCREAAQFIQNEYMLRLKSAPFPTGDETLVPEAGPCSRCPKNTASQRELFADVKDASAGVCTDPVCFKRKREAWGAKAVEVAKSSGRTVIQGVQAKKVAGAGDGSHLHNGYVNLDQRCYDDSKGRTYRQLLGKGFEPSILVVPETGAAVEVASTTAIAPLLKEKGVNKRRGETDDSYRAQQRNAELKAKRETTFRLRVYRAILDKLPKRLERADLELIAFAFFDDVWHETRRVLITEWGWIRDDKDGKLTHEELAKRELPKLTVVQLSQFLFGLTFARELKASTYSNGYGESKQLLATAKRLKVNTDVIRRQLAAEEKAKQPAKKKATKKSARK